MTDIEPVSPGEILLKEFLEPMHISPKQFAKISNFQNQKSI